MDETPFIQEDSSLTGAWGSNWSSRTEENFAGWSLYVENDLFADWIGLNEDRNYTMGVGIALRGRWFAKWLTMAVGRWIYKVSGLSEPARSYHTVMLAGSGFTPDSLGASEPVIGDRPYGSVVGLHSRQVDVRDQGNWTTTSEFIVGALGLDVAKEVQTFIHERNSSVVPQGWDNQISEGGEPTAAIRMNLDRLLWEQKRKSSYRVADVVSGAEAWLGYYTNIAASLRFRLGWFYTKFWEFNASPLAGVAQAADVRKVPKGELFLFGGITGRAVAYNALLQGQFKKNVYEISTSDVERLVGEAMFGVHGGLRGCGWTYHATWIPFSARTAEFKGEFAGPHYWGAIYIGMSRPLDFTSQ